MKAQLPSGRRGVVTVDLKEEARARRERPRDASATQAVEPPPLWTDELPPPPENHDPGGRNER